MAQPIALNLSGRTALVTGAGRGFGAEVAAGLVACACQVYVTDLDQEAADRCAKCLGSGAVAARMDVRRAEEVRAVVARIVAERGSVDILVNNAGIISSRPFLETTPSSAEDVFLTNFWGAVHCCREVLPLMQARGWGKVVNIASVSAARGGGAVGDVTYGASKAALVALTQGLGREMAPHGINVNGVAPGLADTKMTRPYLTDEVRRKVLARFPRGRLATTSDIANAVLFLVSEASAFMSGAVIPVDGGFLVT